MATSQIYNSEQGVLTGAGQWNPNNNNVGEDTLQFSSGAGGDLILEENGGAPDPDTLVSLNGGAFVSFTFVETGTITEGNFAGLTYTIISVDGRAYILFNDAPDATGAYNGSGTIQLANSGDPDIPACFTRGTLIETSRGPVPIEDIEVGEQVLTKHNGMQTVRWIGMRSLKVPHGYEPVLIKAGALGNNSPARDLLLSPQHRVLVTGMHVDLLFNTAEVLVAAKHLVDGVNVIRVHEITEIEYFHFMCDSHQIVTSNGAYTESMHASQISVDAWAVDTRKEILSIFPELSDGFGTYGPTAVPVLCGFERRALSALQR